ncbi:TonB-dependent receptor domain-containing protein [uncultured Parasphingorhabdus sp.]|uniref:TonB-dependent receptor domain-containing protein n=1 Tax=uncultured Parasphingorhabdus sp. TaxID=2709694 RepID=UPI002AA768AA|nr:TonB-dependent receptor [uncultured Parasphingorhabdus sp.]
MSKPAPLASILLFSTALSPLPALAQASPAEVVEPSEAEPTEETQSGDDVDISAPGGGFSGEIIVRGRYIPNSIRNNSSVISVLSTEDIARSGDGDIAGALERVTGLSVDSGGFVYVRGLGDRYSQALLNGTLIPSPEPLKRVVPLDIFPASVLASATVQKSYSVNYPGEFGGGLINLTTAAIPDESYFEFGMGMGMNSETTGKLGYTHFGSDSDWTGFDDGTRDVPAGLAAAFNAGSRIELGPDFTQEQLQDFTASLVNAPTTLVQRNDDIPVNWSADMSAGLVEDIGASRLGVIFNASYSNKFFTRDSIEQGGTTSIIADDGRNVRTDHNIVVSGLLGLGLEVDEHVIRWTNLYIRDSLKQTSLKAADNINTGDIDPSTPADEMRQQTNWIERQLIDTVLVGEFKFGDISLDVRGGYANSQREAPYERSFTYFYDPVAEDYVNNLLTNPQSATIAFSDLNEDVWNGGIDFAYALPTSRNITLSAGYSYVNTSRNAFRRDFRYFPTSSLPFGVSQERPDYLVSDFNVYGGYTEGITTDGIFIQEDQTNAGSQAYDAELTVHGAYVKADVELIDFVQAELGVRYESADQSITALDIYNDGTLVQTAPLKNDYWLPAGTLTWNFAEDMQFRASASKTIARPQFRELARPQYLDPDSGRVFSGNPFLEDSELFNAEARVEYYFGDGERVLLAGFYKKIDNPIEPVAFIPAGSSDFQTTFANAPEAQLYGAEIELLKYFPMDGLGSSDFFADRRFVAIANYTYTDSELKVGTNDTTILDDTLGVRSADQVFIDGSPLTGQSKHLANFQFGIENTERLSQYTFLLSYASDRVTTRGPITGGQPDPDLVQDASLKLDFVAREAVTIGGQELEIKFEARNLTNENFRETQSGNVLIINQQYDLGRSFSIGVKAKF